MFDKARTFMLDHLKAFGVPVFPPIVETARKGVAFGPAAEGIAIMIGKETVIEKLPVAEWLIATGYALLHAQGSDIAPIYFGLKSEADDTSVRVADDIRYIADLAALYQCYLQNPVEVYCIYDDAIELKDEASLQPMAVALGLTHPRGLEAMGYDKQKHADIFEEADFFKPVITQKRPDLSLLVALHNAWQKQNGTAVRIRNEAGTLRFFKAE